MKGAAAFAVAMPFIRSAAAATRTLKVASFGGNFYNTLVRDLYPEFERATGIKVEPVAPGDPNPGVVDLRMVGQEEAARGRAAGMWRALDAGRIPNLALLDKRFVQEGSAGVDAVAGMAWYQTLVVNPKSVAALPASWKTLWEPGHETAWGLAAGGGSALFEITAATWFGGNAILETPEGIRQVLAKIEELKPNVRLWWNSEGAMQTAYENDDVIGGMYFHDVAGLMARDGADIASIFPAEGGVIDFGSWCQPAGSTRIEEAQEFVNFMSAPASQTTMTRALGTPPLVDRKLTDLTEAEFAAVSSDRAPIGIAVGVRARAYDFMSRQFAAMLTS